MELGHFSHKPLATIAIVFTLAASASAQAPRPQTDVEAMLKTFVDAQRNFDQRQLDVILADDYIEISPVGEVDPRAKVLSFYAPDKKVAEAPAAALDEITTRVYGETAVTVARLTYQMKSPDGVAVTRSMRCVFVTRSVDRKWKLVSTQYTAIRK
jgi:ketosteroid isomerase-like protein